MTDIQLGDEVRDVVTGFEGVVVAKVECLFGTDKCEVQQRGLNMDGRPFESVWLPTAQLSKARETTQETGGAARINETSQNQG